MRAPAIRKVTGTASGTGSTVTKTVRTTFSVRVKSIDFDAQAGELHVPGRICAENEHVAMGSHHTLDLELNRQFTLTKDGFEGGEDEEDEGRIAGGSKGKVGSAWDSIAMEQLREATDIVRKAEVYAVIMQEGLANICLITEYQTVLRQRVETGIPRKRVGHGADAHDKGLDKFFDTLLATLLRHIDVAAFTQTDGKAVPPLLLASPGFTSASFHKFIIAYAQKANDKPLLQYARNSIIVAHASSGHVHSLSEALKAPSVVSRLGDTKFGRETQLMDRFMELIRADEGRAWYGPKEVEKAVEKGAIGRGGGVLLISDKLFRSQDIETRRRWVALVEKVRQVEGGEVRVLSSTHESGKKLQGLGDIGAILTFPLLDLDETDEEELLSTIPASNSQINDRPPTTDDFDAFG